MRHAVVQRFGAFEINLQSGELRKNGMRLRLSGQPFQVLALLVERAGAIATRDELRSELWPNETFVDFDHGLNNAVARIREVLEDSASTPRYVETVPRRGYRFIAPLTAIPVAAYPSPPEPEIVTSPAAADSVGSPSSNLTEQKHAIPARRTALLLWALAVTVLVGGLFLYRGIFHSAGPPIRSIAVLPLKNLSGDPKQEYLADGMTEEVIGRLAGIHDLRVISRTSVMRFKDTTLSVPEIAKILHVDALVEGSVIREGSRIRIHAQLIRAATDAHFWSETYDRQISDVLALQSDIAQAIVDKVDVTLSGREHTRLIAAHHVSPEVYESYLKGQFSQHNTQAELEKSIGYFEAAIRMDPTFAPAYVGLASTYQHLSLILVGASPDEMRPKEIQAAEKALALDPELAEAHVLMADVYQKRWQWSDAEAEYNRALSLKPNDAAAHLGFADWLLCQGRIDESIAWARRARELDPLGPPSIGMGWILFQARHYDEAIRELRTVLAVHPDSGMAGFFLGFALIGKGEPEIAIPELEKTVSIMHRSPGSVEILAAAYGYAGHRQEALRLINELKQDRQKGYVPAGAFINPYLSLRDYNQAFGWFEQAYREQSNILQFVKVHPFFDPIRHDPRFEELVRRVGLQ